MWVSIRRRVVDAAECRRVWFSSAGVAVSIRRRVVDAAESEPPLTPGLMTSTFQSAAASWTRRNGVDQVAGGDGGGVSIRRRVVDAAESMPGGGLKIGKLFQSAAASWTRRNVRFQPHKPKPR